MSEDKSCLTCEESRVYGKNIPATFYNPAQHATPECGCDEKGIEIYFDFRDELTKNHGVSQDEYSLAEWCPYYKERD